MRRYQHLYLEPLEKRLVLSFLPGVEYASGPGPGAVVAAEFVTGSGVLDLAVNDVRDNVVGVLPGLGDGTFGKPTAYPTGLLLQGVATGDFNGDGHADLAASSSGNNTVTVWLGNGDGTFGAGVDSA